MIDRAVGTVNSLRPEPFQVAWRSLSRNCFAPASDFASMQPDAEALPVPACLEPAKVDYVAYMDALYYSAVLSAWDGYESATLYVESAANYLNALNAHLDEVKACLPDCP